MKLLNITASVVYVIKTLFSNINKTQHLYFFYTMTLSNIEVCELLFEKQY